MKKRKSKKPSRTRKSQCQKDVLWSLYKELKGATPSKEKILELSQELNLSENQIYKWFWDTKKKVDEDNN
ncbi:MAG: homeobox domain-containing protein [Flammeovirgaceae bacterium]